MNYTTRIICAVVVFVAFFATTCVADYEILVSTPTSVKRYDLVSRAYKGDLITGMTNARDIAISTSGDIYVADYDTDSIWKFHASDGAVTVHDVSAYVDGPEGLAFDRHNGTDTLYVASQLTDSIEQFDSDLNYIGQVASGIVNVSDITFCVNGNLYVSELGTPGATADSRIRKYNSGHGLVYSTVCGAEMNDASGSYAYSVYLYVASPQLGDVVSYYRPTGAYQGWSLKAVSGYTGFVSPQDIVIGPYGYMYITDPGQGKVLMFDGEIFEYIDVWTDVPDCAYIQVVDMDLSPVSFVLDSSLSLPALSKSSFAWGDYDADGDFDLLLAGLTDSNLSMTRLYDNNAGVFSESSVTLQNVNKPLVDFADFDNDGDLDIFLSGAKDGNITTHHFYYQSGGIYSEEYINIQPACEGGVDFGDYNQDGRVDFVYLGDKICGCADPYVSKVFINKTDDFDVDNVLTHNYGKGAVDFGDANNDGHLDILITGDDYALTRYAHIIDGATGTHYSVPGIGGLIYSDVAWADYDNDGLLDFAVVGYDDNSERVAKIFHNDGGFSFSDSGAALTGVSRGSIDWGDYDNDGDMDLVVCGDQSAFQFTTVIYDNSGAGNFFVTHIMPGTKSGKVAFADYDGDSDLDIVITGSTGFAGSTLFYENTGAPANTNPLPPAGLTTTVDGNSITFSWASGSDNETPDTNLTYNLRVGSSPGAQDVMYAQSDLSTGKRFVIDMGNVQHNTSWTIPGFDAGTYYFSVQSVDGAFAGSGWAAEETVVVTQPLGSDKQRVDGETVTLANFIVSGTYDDFFYIEHPAGGWGIRVEEMGAAPGVVVGDEVSVSGTIDTNASYEKYIELGSVIVNSQSNDIPPVFMVNRNVGGADYLYEPAENRGQKGCANGYGANNIGLLVKVYGEVTAVDTVNGWIYLDDGSSMSDGGPDTGLRIVCDTSLVAVGDRVMATGCVSVYETSPGVIHPVVLTRSTSDIVSQ